MEDILIQYQLRAVNDLRVVQSCKTSIALIRYLQMIIYDNVELIISNQPELGILRGLDESNARAQILAPIGSLGPIHSWLAFGALTSLVTAYRREKATLERYAGRHHFPTELVSGLESYWTCMLPFAYQADIQAIFSGSQDQQANLLVAIFCLSMAGTPIPPPVLESVCSLMTTETRFGTFLFAAIILQVVDQGILEALMNRLGFKVYATLMHHFHFLELPLSPASLEQVEIPLLRLAVNRIEFSPWNEQTQNVLQQFGNKSDCISAPAVEWLEESVLPYLVHLQQQVDRLQMPALLFVAATALLTYEIGEFIDQNGSEDHRHLQVIYAQMGKNIERLASAIPLHEIKTNYHGMPSIKIPLMIGIFCLCRTGHYANSRVVAILCNLLHKNEQFELGILSAMLFAISKPSITTTSERKNRDAWDVQTILENFQYLEF